MQWVKPKLIKLSAKKRYRMYDMLHAQAMYVAMGGMPGIDDIEIIQEPLSPVDPETCEAICQHPRTLR